MTPNRKLRLFTLLSLTLVALACGDDAIHQLGDAMVDGAQMLRDATADSLEDTGTALMDAGRVEAQSCTTCSRQFEVITRIENPPMGGTGAAFSVDGFDRVHIGQPGTCYYNVEARFGMDWVHVQEVRVRGVTTLNPVASEYRISSPDEAGCLFVVQGERNRPSM